MAAPLFKADALPSKSHPEACWKPNRVSDLTAATAPGHCATSARRSKQWLWAKRHRKAEVAVAAPVEARVHVELREHLRLARVRGGAFRQSRLQLYRRAHGDITRDSVWAAVGNGDFDEVDFQLLHVRLPCHARLREAIADLLTEALAHPLQNLELGVLLRVPLAQAAWMYNECLLPCALAKRNLAAEMQLACHTLCQANRVR
eukprot:CAMPEP_0177405926 /NCGR_PEP_ID=MMETSP0368-20130122/62266_1 /TAXON_ID=447022 ORGANISM="Scrippsiella hangoei-like, Strain SHHI-4" /NCGR_SAMPLE_ID=MMETSP0368 /ASSEMBLY_ACC=CAM_ASM_000363 /LENGTH=202 /DNA_ID=CAMNT_0018874251 /DNA_START=178 /DNA_END=782 /DNA_ORIENTATION=-